MRYEPFPAQDPSGEPDGQPRRDGARADVELIAEVRVGTGSWGPVRLLDVSEKGFRLAWLPRAEEGVPVKIRIPGLEQLSAVVRWRNETGVGCAFERPLSIYVFEHLVRVAGR